MNRIFPLLAILSTLPACAVRTRPATVEVTSAPVSIESYPNDYYAGRPVYYYGEHWYYREGPSWRYYRTEPVELYRRRTGVRVAPPAYGGPYDHVYAPRTAPAVTPGAPPAPRER